MKGKLFCSACLDAYRPLWEPGKQEEVAEAVRTAMEPQEI